MIFSTIQFWKIVEAKKFILYKIPCLVSENEHILNTYQKFYINVILTSQTFSHGVFTFQIYTLFTVFWNFILLLLRILEPRDVHIILWEYHIAEEPFSSFDPACHVANTRKNKQSTLIDLVSGCAFKTWALKFKGLSFRKNFFFRFTELQSELERKITVLNIK